MKLSVAREALLERLQTLVRVASTHSAVQALSGVQVDATETDVELRATDLEVGLRMPLEGEVARPGVVVLPARLLLDVVRALHARPGSGDTRLVAMTGYGQESDLEQTRADGFDHHLVKPVEESELRDVLARAAADLPLPSVPSRTVHGAA